MALTSVFWDQDSKKNLNDGQVSIDTAVNWPGYIANDQHPFGFCYNQFHGDIKWSSTDSPQTFARNKAKAPKDWHYLTKDVEYHVNSSGFRTKEWNDIDWKNSVVILGDSCTYGVGLAEDETISTRLESMLGRPVINLGVPGSSNPSIVNNSSVIINKFDIPYAVVINWSSPNRFRYYYSNGYMDVSQSIFHKTPLGNNLVIENTNITDLWTNTYINPTNEMCLNYFLSQNANAMWKGKSKQISISFFLETAHYTRCDRYFQNHGTARDMVHPGPEDANEVAAYLYERLK